MPEVFREIVDCQGKPGRIEKFVVIEVRVCDAPSDVDEDALDGPGRQRLRRFAKDSKYEAAAGIAKIGWKSDADRKACRKEFERGSNRHRWQRISDFVERMRGGEFPQFAHVYLHPTLTGQEGLMFIDGTRRLLAYLEFGRDEMPVVVFRAKAKG